MNIVILQAEHPQVPGRPMKAFTDKEAGAADALVLVNLIRAEPYNDDGEVLRAAPDGADWQEALAEWQRLYWIGKGEDADDVNIAPFHELAVDCPGEVWFEEVELVLGAIPGENTVQALVEAAKDCAAVLNNARETAIYDGDEPPNSPEARAIAAVGKAAWDAEFVLAWKAQHVEEVPAPRVAIGLEHGRIQWTLTNRPGVKVEVLDFDVYDRKFRFRRVTDNTGAEGVAQVYEEVPGLQPDYFDRLDVAAVCNGDGEVEE